MLRCLPVTDERLVVDGYYRGPRGFTFFVDSRVPDWRSPQRGAIGELFSHWSLPRQPPALISLPTGAGKTAVALTAPHLIEARRVLVLVPGRDLRRQTVIAFRSQAVLRHVGALTGPGDPTVVELSGLVDDWSVIRDADVVVALPNSISPAYYSEPVVPPPQDLFDLIVVDEAHHMPARTWRSILEHFKHDHAVLLTATPRRRDGQRLPGEHVYHYPLRQALDEGFYKPVQPILLDLPPDPSRDQVDQLIAAEAVRLASTPEHATSTILIRASTKERANALAAVYLQHGLNVPALHSGLGTRARESLVERIRSGECRAVAVVNMLGEGFDLPSLRIVAYHDKHKSLPATVQLIGRLVRVDRRYPQPSVVVAARDIDVHPQLQGAARELYAEDTDWAEALPGLIDNEIVEDKADRAYARAFDAAPPALSVESLTPVCRAVMYEIDAGQGFQPVFADGIVPEPLREGQRLRGQTILYSSVSPTNSTLVVVTTTVDRPRWHPTSPGLDTSTYDLHLMTWKPARRVDQPHLMLVNSADRAIIRDLMTAVGADPYARATDPRRLQDAFDGLDRISVSSVGVRNTYHGGKGVPTYTMYAGSGVDRGLRDADTSRRALGHAMAQIGSEVGTYTAGVSTGKSKYWETRYVPLRHYEAFATSLASRYWFPPPSVAGPLLPNVTRGSRLTAFPTADIAMIELNPALLGQGWTTVNGGPIDDLDLRFDPSQPRTEGQLPILAADPAAPEVPVWQGFQDILGRIHAGATTLQVRLGYNSPIPFEELLTNRPPNIFFLDGNTVHGSTLYHSLEPRNDLPQVDYVQVPWSGVDMTAETRAVAARKAAGISIHEELENYLIAQPKRARHRWILCNDGPREIADYIVIEMDPGLRVTVSLWHAKAAGGTSPSVRVEDLQVVTQQAIKSRRYITDRDLWKTLGARLIGKDSPPINVVEGSHTALLVLCGQNPDHPTWSIARRAPVVTGRIGIAQPGLSMTKLRADLATDSPSIAARQIREFLTVLHDATSSICDLAVLASQ